MAVGSFEKELEKLCTFAVEMEGPSSWDLIIP
jgi:hypothetical protein